MFFLFKRDFYREAFRFLARWFISAGLAAWAHTFGILTLKARNLISLIDRHYQVHVLEPEKKLKQVLVENLFQKLSCDLACPGEESGGVALLELLVLNTFIREQKPAFIFEFGTFKGRSTMNFALNSPRHTIIYTLDLPREGLSRTKLRTEFADRKHIDKAVSGEMFLKSPFPERKKIRQLFGDSAALDYTPFLNRFDFIFIDGSHHYDYIMNDSLAALRLLKKKKGIIVWHDYGGWPGVTRALNELSQRSDFQKIRGIAGTSLAFLQL